MIYLASLPRDCLKASRLKIIIRDYNLAPVIPGKGNRAKRRQGLYVHNPDHSKPFGLIGMDRGQIAQMMRTKPDTERHESIINLIKRIQ